MAVPGSAIQFQAWVRRQFVPAPTKKIRVVVQAPAIPIVSLRLKGTPKRPSLEFEEKAYAGIFSTRIRAGQVQLG